MVECLIILVTQKHWNVLYLSCVLLQGTLIMLPIATVYFPCASSWCCCIIIFYLMWLSLDPWLMIRHLVLPLRKCSFDLQWKRSDMNRQLVIMGVGYSQNAGILVALIRLSLGPEYSKIKFDLVWIPNCVVKEVQLFFLLLQMQQRHRRYWQLWSCDIQ